MTDHHTSMSASVPSSSGSVRQHLLIVSMSVILTAQLVPTGLPSDPGPAPAPMAEVVFVPAEVETILRRSCYDCHSNTTAVPWYGALQPVGGWMAEHVREGRAELNVDEFGTYRARRQYVKLAQIADEVRSDAMPLPSYLWMHGDARLSDADRTRLFGWVSAARAEIEGRYPPDSLMRRR